jgi:UDPglucose 6-dehydrogenase
MYITVIGTGYVGLVAGACFADKGYDVCCVDVDENKINLLNSGKIPIYEPGLKDVVERAVKREHLIFSTDLEKAYLTSKAIFICVGTPEGADGRPNMTYVYAVARSIGEIQKKHPEITEQKVVATKSTVPVGTGDEIEKILTEAGVTNIDVASNPEFLKEGSAINDFVRPDRIIIGVNAEHGQNLLSEIYTPFTRKNERMLVMDRRSAEMTKYAANSMLALRITFMNQVAVLCEKIGADVQSVRKGIGSDTRIGPSFLFPGPGYGGSCFPKDVKALIELGHDNSFPLTIMESVDVFNQKQKHYLAEKVISYFGSDLEGKTIGIWGLAFKPETDDVRESPALYIIEDLIKAKANIKAYDPEAMDTFRKQLDHINITFCSTLYDASKACDAIVVVTDWNEFKMPNFEKLASILKNRIVFDGRNLYAPQKMKELGFEYFGLGRKKI